MTTITKLTMPSLGEPLGFSLAGDDALWLQLPLEDDDDTLRDCLARHIAPLEGIAYVELSSRVWDGGTPQFELACRRGRELRLPGPNKYYQAIAYALSRSLAMFEIARKCSAISQPFRVFGIGGNLDLAVQAFEHVYCDRDWNPAGQTIDVLSIDDGTRSDVEPIARRFGIPRIAFVRDGLGVVSL